jgi:hypothetical protein
VGIAATTTVEAIKEYAMSVRYVSLALCGVVAL